MSNNNQLTSLRVGERGRITGLSTNDPNMLRKLMALGIYPGLPIHLLQKFPSYVFQVGFTQLAVDQEIAQEIRVTKENNK